MLLFGSNANVKTLPNFKPLLLMIITVIYCLSKGKNATVIFALGLYFAAIVVFGFFVLFGKSVLNNS